MSPAPTPGCRGRAEPMACRYRHSERNRVVEEDEHVRRQQATILGFGFALVMVLASAPNAIAQGQSVTLNLSSQNNSGISGAATLTEMSGGKLRVELRVNGAGAGPQPAHIHEGTCANLDPAPKFSLTPVTNGTSTTEVDASLQQLTSTPHAIHMHKSPDELPVYVACADIRTAAQPATLPRSGGGPLGALAAGFAGLAIMAAGFALRRRASRTAPF
jgi:Cu/Zn superoxide dismutase